MEIKEDISKNEIEKKKGLDQSKSLFHIVQSPFFNWTKLWFMKIYSFFFFFRMTKIKEKSMKETGGMIIIIVRVFEE